MDSGSQREKTTINHKVWRQHDREFVHKTHSEQTFENWWKLDLEKITFEIVMFLIFSPNHDFFKKVAHDNSESFAPILNWGWLFPGRFVTKNHFEERVILGPFLTILTFFQNRARNAFPSSFFIKKFARVDCNRRFGPEMPYLSRFGGSIFYIFCTKKIKNDTWKLPHLFQRNAASASWSRLRAVSLFKP